MQTFVPTAYIKVVKPGAAPGVGQPTPMMGYDYVLTAGAQVPDETITKIVKLLHDNPDKVRGILKTFAEFTPAEMAPKLGGLDLSSGSRRLLRASWVDEVKR